MKKLLLSVALVILSLFNAKAQTTPNDFCYYGAEYAASFDAPDVGAYYLGGPFFNSKGWGGEFTIGANYGLMDSDHASVMFNAGPAYGYAISDKVLAYASLCFSGAYSEKGSTSNSKGTKKTNESKFYAGATLKPQVIFKFRKFLPHAGLVFQYSGALDKFNVGFVAGFGFDF